MFGRLAIAVHRGTSVAGMTTWGFKSCVYRESSRETEPNTTNRLCKKTRYSVVQYFILLLDPALRRKVAKLFVWVLSSHARIS